MGFWFLDDKSQLALLIAGLVGSVGAAGCDDTPVVVDPAVRDARVDGPPVVDPAPIDFRMERPGDSRLDLPPVVDPAPVDLRADRSKVDSPMVVDMLPPDAAAGATPAPRAPSRQPGKELPLQRDLRARVVARSLAGGVLELQARPMGAAPEKLSYHWRVSGGQLDRRDVAKVRWTPPRSPGAHLAQVTVRDGTRAIAVEAFLHIVK